MRVIPSLQNPAALSGKRLDQVGLVRLIAAERIRPSTRKAISDYAPYRGDELCRAQTALPSFQGAKPKINRPTKTCADGALGEVKERKEVRDVCIFTAATQQVSINNNNNNNNKWERF